MNYYKCLNNQIFSQNNYSIIPIRMEDRFDIMKWRNEQMFHLRQTKILTKNDQDNYFKNTIKPLFEQEFPDQILFSYMYNEKCIGYGGLVHINWLNNNAEISFIMDTNLEKLEFEKHWTNYLNLLYKVAFDELKLHKIYTYAFDLRPHIYEVFEKNGLIKEAVLKEHYLFNNKYIDIVIHSKYIQ